MESRNLTHIFGYGKLPLREKERRFYLAPVIFCLTVQVAWVVENMYFNVFTYNLPA